MPFSPPRLLLAYDDARGHCGAVVPTLQEMLEARAFEVDLHPVAEGPVDLEGYRGLVLGTPAFGLGWKGVGPTAEVEAFVKGLEDLDEVKTAIFCVYEVRPGWTLRNLRQMVVDAGGEVVAQHAYARLRPQEQAHILPAECMVRIR